MKVCLVLTHQCNLGCSYCYAGEKFSRAMTLETGQKALRLAFQKPGPIEVSFFGGEPMIAFDALASLTRLASKWAKRNGRELRFSVTTNATILTDKHLRFLAHYNFFVGISVDGLAKDHDKHRPFVGGRGSGELVWQNLERACEVLPDFRVLTVVRPDTFAGLPEAVERMYRLGVGRLTLLPDMEADWSEVRWRVQDVYRQLARVTALSILTDEPMFISPFYEQLLSNQQPGSGEAHGACGFGTDEVAIAPSGNFYPCARLVGPDRRDEVRIGNIASGFDQNRIQKLQAQARGKLSACGSGGCECAALMPGDANFQLKNVAMFTEMVGDVCQEAEEVVAA